MRRRELHRDDRTYCSTMDSAEVAKALDRAETAVKEGSGLSGTGFWPAVAAVKRDPKLVEQHADRIAQIDMSAFSSWPLLRIPIRVGTTLALAAFVAGLALIAGSYYAGGVAATVLFLAGLGALLATTHGLGHLLVGTLVGIRFTDWFVGSITRPQPGVKIDYSSYLRTRPRRRAWMHASGALATKITPFAVLGVVVPAGLPGWIFWMLLLLGAAMIATDIAWSTKSSDWKKFRREMRLAQS